MKPQFKRAADDAIELELHGCVVMASEIRGNFCHISAHAKGDTHAMGKLNYDDVGEVAAFFQILLGEMVRCHAVEKANEIQKG